MLCVGRPGNQIEDFLSRKLRKSSNAYIHDGLVSMWDGIDNVHIGHHDNSATRWKDLVSGIDSAAFTDQVFFDDHLQTSIDALRLIQSNAKSLLGNPSTLTIEVVKEEVTASANTNAANGIALPYGLTVHYFRHNANDVYGPLGFCDRTKYGFCGNSTLFPPAQAVPIGTRSIIVKNISAATRTFIGWNDAISVAAVPNKFTYGTAADNDYISLGGSTSGTYNVYCIRIYNRELTAEEILHNHKVDCMRFNFGEHYVEPEAEDPAYEIPDFVQNVNAEGDMIQFSASYKSPDWFTDSSSESWDAVESPTNFKLLTTPDTTYCLFTSYDMSYKDTCPESCVPNMVSIFNEYSDHITTLENKNVLKDRVLTEFEVLKTKHACVYYEFSHGGESGYITTYNPSGSGIITNEQVFDFVENAQGKVFCMFDSCYSGTMGELSDNSNSSLKKLNMTLKSVVPPSNLTTAQQFATSTAEDLAQYIMRRLNQKKPKLFAATGDPEPISEKSIMIWASCEAGHKCYYCPMSYSFFNNGIKSASSRYKDYRYGDIWPKVKQEGSMYTSYPADNPDRCIPQCYQYGLSQDGVLTWL